MTQVIFTVNEEVTALRLNQATQGYKFVRRTTYAGSAGSPVGLATFATATWNIGSGTSALYVRVCGGGSGSLWCQGGSGAGPGNGSSGIAAGGGGGGYSERWILTGFGVTQMVRIGLGRRAGIATTTAPGNGGESSFGTFLSAGGGAAGGAINNTQEVVFIVGGNGGVGSGGNINASGTSGGVGFILFQNSVISGRGGQSAFGGAGGVEAVSTSPTQVGTFPGQGGRLHGGGASGGAVKSAISLTNANGAAGASGFVIVDEYA